QHRERFKRRLGTEEQPYFDLHVFGLPGGFQVQLNHQIGAGFQPPRQLALARERLLAWCPAEEVSVWINCRGREPAIVARGRIFLISAAGIRRLVDEHRRVVDRARSWPEIERLDVAQSVDRNRDDESSEYVRTIGR